MLKQLLSVLLVSFFVALTPAGIAVAGIDGVVAEPIEIPSLYYDGEPIQMGFVNPWELRTTEQVIKNLDPSTFSELVAYVNHTKARGVPGKLVALGSEWDINGTKFVPSYDPETGLFDLVLRDRKWEARQWSFLFTHGIRWADFPLIKELNFSLNREALNEDDDTAIMIEACRWFMNFEHRKLVDRIEFFRTAVEESWSEETQQYYVSIRTTILCAFDIGDALESTGLSGTVWSEERAPNLDPETCDEQPWVVMGGGYVPSGPEITEERRRALRDETIRASWRNAMTDLTEKLLPLSEKEEGQFEEIIVTPARGNPFLKIGETLQLSLMARRSANYPTHDVWGGEATYQVSDPNVASVDATGLVSGIGEGTATIIVRYHALEAQVTVTVLKVF